MAAVKVRRLVARRGLDAGDRHFLLHGSSLGRPTRFQWRDPAGEWHTDRDAAEVAWREHRDELLAEAAEHGLIPWAGRRFEDMPGPISPYEHLTGDRRHLS